MSWNHRVVIALQGTEEEYWSIREVYYNDDGEICAMSEGGASPMGEDMDELRGDLLHMLNALYKDVIVLDDDFVFARWNFDPRDCDDLGLTDEAREIYGKKEKE